MCTRVLLGPSAQDEALNRKVAEKEQLLRQRDSAVEQQALEIAMLRQQLQALQSSCGPALTAAVGGGSGSTQSASAVAQSAAPDSGTAVAEAVALANKQHAIAIESAHRTYKAKLLIAQQAEQAALRELSARQEDLKQERERSLQTMRQLRESQDKRNEEENAHKMRTVEFLEEIATLRDTTEDQLARNDALTQRVRELTATLAESVSKVQVKEMERLFIETVSRLSDRVNLLEGKQKTSGTGGSSVAAPTVPGPSTVVSGSAGSTREVRIEPGGRIRASNSGGGTAGSGKYNSAAVQQSMQHSQSTGTVPPAASSGGASSESNSEKRSNAGKLW
jgi:hypothetical protein